MDEHNVTSHNQRGGITAYTVNISNSLKAHGLPLWLQLLVAASTIVGAIVGVLVLLITEG